MNHINPILNTDSYKTSHFLQYPPGTTYVSSYIEARPVAGYDEVLFFGLQMFIRDYLTGTYKLINTKVIDEAEAFFTAHGVPFNRRGWEIIADDYNGYLPLEICALPEGMVVPTGTPLVQVVNTDDRLPWLTSYLETALLRAVWYPSTVATNSRACKKILADALFMSSDNPAAALPFKLHDFGARGTAANEQAGIGGAAHLVNFMGTDTVMGAYYAMQFYDCPMPGFSIPAAEHSTITSWGVNREEDAYANMLDKFGNGLVAVVSDSYDFYNALENIWGGSLRDKVLSMGGTLVIRPDSGDPLILVMQSLETLGELFGFTINSKGYKVLNPKVRIIQGDGVDKDKIALIVGNMLADGWSIDNVAFGMGAGLLQHVNRDTLRFAMKASAICDTGFRWRSVQKLPKTDMSKASKPGIQYVFEQNDKIIVENSRAPTHYDDDLLQPVYRMTRGMSKPQTKFWTFDEVRKLAAYKGL